jgi:hypothetical protein
MDLPSFDELNLIRDPETGLALLAKCASGKMPEQERERLFWQLQFTSWRDWRAGDTTAFGHALVDCSLFNMLLPLAVEAGSGFVRVCQRRETCVVCHEIAT